MANMSYCRFHNTLMDLEDCYEHLNDTDLSRDEENARARLIELCDMMVGDFKDNIWEEDVLEWNAEDEE